MSASGKKTPSFHLTGILVAGGLLASLACQEQTWESAMTDGQKAVQQGNYAEAEGIYKVAIK